MDRLLTKLKATLSPYLRYLFIAFFVLLTASLARNVIRILKAGQRVEETEGRVEKLKEENEELKKRLEMIGSQEYIEKQLRDNLGLAKEGEIVIVLPDEETLRALAPRPQKEEEVLPDPNWKRWMNLFFE
jgi:cell division protein FtsB